MVILTYKEVNRMKYEYSTVIVKIFSFDSLDIPKKIIKGK